MAESRHTTRRTVLQGLIVASVAAAIPAVAVDEEDTVHEIMRLRAQLSPMERVFFDQQLYDMHDGRPNLIDGTAGYTYEEWLTEFHPWEIAIIEAGPRRAA